MDFIRLTMLSGRSRRINLNHISSYIENIENELNSHVTINDETILVKETPEEIDGLIAELYEVSNG